MSPSPVSPPCRVCVRSEAILSALHHRELLARAYPCFMRPPRLGALPPRKARPLLRLVPHLPLHCRNCYLLCLFMREALRSCSMYAMMRSCTGLVQQRYNAAHVLREDGTGPQTSPALVWSGDQVRSENDVTLSLVCINGSGYRWKRCVYALLVACSLALVLVK